MADDETPGLRVIEGTGNPERERAERRVSWALRNLTANLLRVARGAGKDYEIPEQAIELITALREYSQHDSFLPDLGRFLRTWDDIDLDTPRPHFAKHEIICGALQIVASQLVGQLSILRRGQSELNDGLRDWNEAVAEIRRSRS